MLVYMNYAKWKLRVLKTRKGGGSIRNNRVAKGMIEKGW